MPVIDITKDLAALFVRQARETPNLVALQDEAASWTYAELDRETQALADRLRSDHGVGRDDLVGVLMERSADYVVACLAALRAGGAFLVLELAYPPSLLAGVIDDAKPTVVVTKKAHVEQIRTEVSLVVLDDLSTGVNGSAKLNGSVKEPSPLPAEDDLDRLAFVSYSSGTTGKPKGIANPHSAPVRSYDLRFRLSDLKPGDRVACNVFFVWEILRPLLRGATVFAVPDEASYDPVALVELLAAKKITETLMTPTLLATILSRYTNLGERLPDLRTLWLNGEVVTADLARRTMKALPNIRLLNCYSASETHEIACGDINAMLTEDSIVSPVGPPMEPEFIYILDEEGNKVKDGVTGELVVGGNLLARGYLNLPETTAEAFKPDPFRKSSTARMYRTGDMARMLPSGVLEITGRVGAMIKLRGYSIQPGAVENQIIKHLDIRQCAVIAYGDGLERQLVAYVVRDSEELGDRTSLVIDESGYSPVARRILSPHLAHYMIPSQWVELDNLPTHGVSAKADLKSLHPPKNLKARTITHDLNNKAESDSEINLSSIMRLWAASLNVPVHAVQPEYGFFDLGGHSLALADLASRMTKTFGFRVPVVPLAGNPTLQGHLDIVKSARDGATQAVQADLASVIQSDSVLPADFQPSNTTTRLLSEADTILITGTTGFLGAFLLKDLLESTTARILCLIRFTDPSMSDSRPAGVSRLRKNLLDLGIWQDSMLDRIEVLPGNLAQKRFGLTSDAFDELAARVQVIVHAGATVNLVYPYAAMRGANVGGTREILRLACKGGSTVHYVSTNGVLPPSIKGWPETAMVEADAVTKTLADGYGQTKWVAEQLILEAARRGLPARIYRPGTISGHSTLGSTNTYDLLTALFVESIHLGHAPDIEGWVAEMTPVDFVSKSIVSLADNPDSEQKVLHLGDPKPVMVHEFFDSLAELGYSTKRLPWDKWVTLWNDKRGSSVGGDESFTANILRRGMPTVELLKSIAVLDDPATKPLLDVCGLERPKVDSRLLETYTRHFYARGWLPSPPRRQQSSLSTISPKKGPLAGRVAVVTGASSGIGAAVALALARQGAHVALAARRVEPLKSLKAQIERQGSKVIAHPTDVTDRAQVEALMKAAADELGPVDILVACAGVMYYTLMANVQTEQWERTVDVNCKGLLHCLSSTVPGMLARGRGHVVAISSDAGRKVFPGLGVYSASKFFVEATLQSLRLETAGSGLRVTSVQPGNTATELLGLSTDQEAVKKYGEPSGAKVLDPSDVANSIVYALSQPEHVAVNEVLIEPRDEPI